MTYITNMEPIYVTLTYGIRECLSLSTNIIKINMIEMGIYHCMIHLYISPDGQLVSYV